VLGSTLLFALYTVLYKKWSIYFLEDVLVVSSDENAEIYEDQFYQSTHQVIVTLQTVSLMGLINLLTMWCFVVIANWLKIEVVSYINLKDVFYFLLIGISGALYSLFSLLAIVLINPFFVSIATLLTIPLSIISDFCIHQKLPNPFSYIGIMLICISLFILVLPKRKVKDVRNNSSSAEA
jgi:drug/metabolite transporter (DMT)-like permease